MIPNQAQVAPLEDYGVRDFAGWLRRGLEDYRHPQAKRTAFAPLAAFVGHGPDPTLELRDIYELLSGSARKNLRLGLAEAMDSLPPVYDSLPVLREMLHLAGRLRAKEALHPILTQIGTGFFGRSEIPETRDLFAFALEIVAGMAPGADVAAALRHLTGTPHFEPGYVPMVFIALCRAQPERFPEHLEHLRPYFAALHRTESDLAGVELTARRFAHYVPLDTIAENLYRLQYSLNPSAPPWALDNWLVNALFRGDRAPLALMPSAQGGTFGLGPQDNFWIGLMDSDPPYGVPVALPADNALRPRTVACREYLQRLARALQYQASPSSSTDIPASAAPNANRNQSPASLLIELMLALHAPRPSPAR
jgi:hypothetical protein